MSNLDKVNKFTTVVTKQNSYFLVTKYDEVQVVVEADSVSSAWAWVERQYDTTQPLDLGYNIKKIPYYKA